jgi:hypothetical protein
LLASQARLGSLQSKSGWILNNVPMLEIDRGRIERVVRKVVKGLYFHHQRVLLPIEVPFFIAVETIDLEGTLQETAELWKSVEGYKLGQVLTYRFGVVEGSPTVSIWWLVFFNGVVFTVITGIEDGDGPDVVA